MEELKQLLEELKQNVEKLEDELAEEQWLRKILSENYSWISCMIDEFLEFKGIDPDEFIDFLAGKTGKVE